LVDNKFRLYANLTGTEITELGTFTNNPLEKVTVDQFKADHDYIAGELIVEDDSIYKCVSDFHSGSTFDSSDWSKLSADSRMVIDKFEPNASYKKDELIYTNGSIYKAKIDFTAGATFNSNDWDSFSSERLVYNHVQNVEATTWNIQHDFDTIRPLQVTVFDQTGEQMFCDTNYVASTNNVLVLEFGIPMAGTAVVTN
jgi:hypothetical protein